MTGLGDLFPEKMREGFALRNLKPGAVIRMFVPDTTPPKIKLIIIVAIEDEHILAATLFINSEVNPDVISSPELQALQHKLFADKYDFLKHDSFIDCSALRERSINSLEQLMSTATDSFLGTLDETDFPAVKKLLISAKSIPVRLKKKYHFL